MANLNLNFRADSASGSATIPLASAADVELLTVAGRTFAYVAAAGSDAISVFSVGTTGSLAYLGGTSDVFSTAIDNPLNLASVKIGSEQYLYSNGAADGGFTAFRVLPNGLLLRVDAEFGFSEPNGEIAVARIGATNFILAPSNSGVAIFRIGADGGMTLTQNFGIGDGGRSYSGATHAVTIGTNTYIYASGIGGSLNAYELQANGEVRYIETTSDNASLFIGSSRAIESSSIDGSTFLFVTGTDYFEPGTEDGISVFLINSDGTLSSVRNYADSVRFTDVSDLETFSYGGSEYLLATSANSAMSLYEVGSFGSLTLVDSRPFDDAYGADIAIVGGRPILVSAEYATSSISSYILLDGPPDPTQFDDSLTGTAAGNRIDGLGGNDRIDGLAGNDTVLGAAGNDVLIGGTGNDVINGGVGNDLMVGGAGGDAYVVDSIGDRISEAAGPAGGNDLVTASVSYMLSANVERLTLAGVASLAGNGNALSNTMAGNAAANRLSGLDGNDTLVGNAGNDALIGGSGADYLNGGVGADTMTGGAGYDRYAVDSAADRVVEGGGITGGIDIVTSTISLTLSTSVENLILGGLGAIAGRGNAAANVIAGNAAGNVIGGLDGSDILRGNGGNDNIAGGNGNDTMDGGPGADVLQFGSGRDVVLGFQNDVDTLLFDDALLGGQPRTPAGILSFGVVQGSEAVFTFAGGYTLTVEGVTSLAQLSNDVGFF